MGKRINELDSIRGLAALIVLFHHMYLDLNNNTSFPPIIFKYSPLRVLTNGHASVIMFFILSGYVLSLPFINTKASNYGSFVLKRISRIYLPFVVSLFAAVFTISQTSREGKLFFSGLFSGSWHSNLNINLILEHMSLIGNLHTYAINDVYWSLVHEMRISLIFPLLMILVLRLNWVLNVLICIGLSFAAGLNNVFNIQTNNGYHTSYFDSLHYASLFIIGALLARYSSHLTEFFKNIPRGIKWSVVALAFLTYTYSTIGLIMNTPYFGEELNDYWISFGAIVFIVLALNSAKVSKLLMLKPIKFLGKISFSLYLYHLIILYALIKLLVATAPLWSIYLLTVVASLLISSIAWRYIEVPSVIIGKKLSSISLKSFRIKRLRKVVFIQEEK